MPHRRTAWAVLFALFVVSCAGYAGRTRDLRIAIVEGNLDLALQQADALVAYAEAGRGDYADDLPLLLLERAALLQADQQHDAAVNDLMQADQMMEVLDLTPDGVGQAAEYLWSDSADVYRPPIYEKMMINVLALSSFLALGEESSAQIEARRILVLANYFENTAIGDHPMLGAALAFAGLANEAAGNLNEAGRFYADAMAYGETDFVTDSYDHVSEREESSEIVAIVFSGLPPRREAQVQPILTVYEWSLIGGSYAYSEEQMAAYNRFVAESLLTTVNFPVLVTQGHQRSGFIVQSEDRERTTDLFADVESFALAQWEEERPALAWSAITRALVRIVAREAIQGIGNAATNEDDSTARLFVFLGSLVAQGVMTAMDVPDTRTWTSMPAYIDIVRIPAQPGTQTVRIVPTREDLEVQELEVDVPEDGIGVVVARYL